MYAVSRTKFSRGEPSFFSFFVIITIRFRQPTSFDFPSTMKVLATLFGLSALVGQAAASTDMDFDTYLDTYDIEIEDSDYDLRAGIFKTNLESIREHNSGDSSYDLGVTRFAHLTQEEFTNTVARGYNKGLARGLGETFGAIPAREEDYLDEAALPKVKDWRTNKPPVLTPVKNQLSCGSCWAFASTESSESHLAISFNKLLTLSPQQLVDCAPNPDQCGGTGGCEVSYGSI